MNDCIKEAQDFCKETGTTIEFERVGIVNDPWHIGMNTWHDQYIATIERNGIVREFEFTQSSNDTELGIEPNEYDVLSCLTKFEPGEYWDFCHEYGMENSQESWDTWQAVTEEWYKVCDLFGDCIGKLQEIW